MNVALAESWEKLKLDVPNLRIRDAAKQLGVSEVELLTTRFGNGVYSLKNEWPVFLRETPTLGYVMVLTRNECCVHERKGEFKNVTVTGNMGLVTGDDIDLRIFLQHWVYGFYVEEKRESGILRSFQFFDSNGESVHKIYATGKSILEAWENLKKLMIAEESLKIEIQESVSVLNAKTFDATRSNEFLNDWSNLKDTHDFFGLLKKYDLDRKQALTFASEKFTKKVKNDTFAKLLKECSDNKQEVMIFVGNIGVIQIHTGLVSRLETMGPWFNVLDPDFNLHLRQDLVSETWIVDKPTADGIVSSLELFADDGVLILQLFGKRKPGQAQLESWEKLIHSY